MRRFQQVSIAVSCVLILSISVPAATSSAANAASVHSALVTSAVKVQSQTTLYGKVTAIKGNKVTLALGTLNTSQSGDLLALTGKSVTITIKDTSILTKGTLKNSATKNESASLSEITAGMVLKITYKSNVKNLVSVQLILSQASYDDEATSAITGSGKYQMKDKEIIVGDTYSSEESDENAIRVDNSITATIMEAHVNKYTGNTTNSDASNRYGLNAVILALGHSSLYVTRCYINSRAIGATGIFAYNGTSVNIRESEVDVIGNGTQGIAVAGGSIINAIALKVDSTGGAAIYNRDEDSTITLSGGTYTTHNSSEAPVIHAAGPVSAFDAALNAYSSQFAIVEGDGSVSLNNCTASGNMPDAYGTNKNTPVYNVLLCGTSQGTKGNSSFSMDNSSLTSNNGDMFYVTNTNSTITIKNSGLFPANKAKLLTVAGNDGTKGWGTAGSNGGSCTLETSKQKLTGSIAVDSISSLAMNLTDSSLFTGAINSDGAKALSIVVTMDSTSKWELTADSYITELDGSLDNVNTNGYTLYVSGKAVK